MSLPRGTSILAIAIAALFAATACSSAAPTGSTNGASSKLPATIKVASIEDATGANALSGGFANTGTELAVAEVNSQKFLGNTKLSLTEQDTTSTSSLAVSELNADIVNPAYSVVLGPALSSEAVTMSPLAEKDHMPLIYTEAGSAGVLLGPYEFRATPPSSTLQPIVAKYLQGKGVKKAAVIYVSDNPTTASVGTKTWPALGPQYGFSVTTTAVQNATVDMSVPVSKVLAGKPDAVILIISNAQQSPAVVALRGAGFTGIITSLAGGAGVLAAAGSAADGVVYATDFSPLNQDPGTNAFVKAYEAKYHTVPTNFAAEAFDRVWWLARAIKEANSAGRDAIQKGLVAVAKTGFDGALGRITFRGNDMRVAGNLVEWNGATEVLVKS